MAAAAAAVEAAAWGNQAGREPQVCRCGFFSFSPGHTRTFPPCLPVTPQVRGFKQGTNKMPMQVWFLGFWLSATNKRHICQQFQSFTAECNFLSVMAVWKFRTDESSVQPTIFSSALFPLIEWFYPRVNPLDCPHSSAPLQFQIVGRSDSSTEPLGSAPERPHSTPAVAQSVGVAQCLVFLSASALRCSLDSCLWILTV